MRVFVEGLYLNRVSDKAPEFIITNQSIHVEKLSQWLEQNKNLVDEKGYIKIVGMESKDKTKRYQLWNAWSSSVTLLAMLFLNRSASSCPGTTESDVDSRDSINVMG